LDLFPEQSKTGTYVSRYVQELEILESTNISTSSILITKPESVTSGDGKQQQPVAGQGLEESAVSSMSDLSTKNVRRWNLSLDTPLPSESANSVAESSGTGTSIKHNRNDCLWCCRAGFIGRFIKNTGILQDPGGLRQRRSHQDISFYSPESILSDDSSMNVHERVTAMILRNVEKMGNPAFHKPGKQQLLELKQKYPKCFQDICLYSEVSKLLSKSTYRLGCRRFIQEIFLDLNFDVFYDDLELVIQVLEQRLKDTKLMESLSQTSSPPPSIIVPPHKIHSIKSPQLASVFETSVENLAERTSREEVTTVAQVEIRPPKNSNGQDIQNRHSSGDLNELNVNSSIRRRRFNTLELDLTCTKNKFPLTHRTKDFSPTSGPAKPGETSNSTYSSYSSFSRTGTIEKSSKDEENSKLSSSNNSSVINLNNSNNDTTRRRTSSGAEMETTKSLSTVTTPTSPPFVGRLYCEERLLTTSKSEAALSNNKTT
jgi:hypothetical protein